MRALVGFGLAFLVLTVTAMGVALVGRSLDWSPFALVMLGAIAGLMVGVGLTITLYVTDPEARSDYDLGYAQGRQDATERRRATR